MKLKKTLFLFLKIVLSLFLLLFIFAVALYLRTRGNYEVAKTVEYDMSLPQVVINGIPFHAETFGDTCNPVVIVLHGGPGNDYRYLLPLTSLADRFHVVMYDQRGSGLSPRVPKEQLSLELSLQDLDAFVTHFGKGKPVHLIGHSWGAMLACAYTATNPQKVGRVVLAEPGMLTSEQGERFRKKAKVKMSFKLVKELTMAYFESLHIKEYDGQERGDYIFQKIAMLDIPENPLSAYYCNRTAKSGHLPIWRLSHLSSIEIPKGAIKKGKIQLDLISGINNYPDTVLFISSMCNTLIGAEYQKDHIKHFPRVRHVELPNVGHTMFGEEPALCDSIVRDYLMFEKTDSTIAE